MHAMRFWDDAYSNEARPSIIAILILTAAMRIDLMTE